MTLLPRHVHFVGFGLIGSSLARALRVLNPAICLTVYDHNPNVRQKILDLGLVDQVVESLNPVPEAAELVVLAVPMLALAEVLAQIQVPAQAILTDVGSVKGTVEAALRLYAPSLLPRFVLGHPLAGTEHSGPEYGFAELFQNRWCLLTPLAETHPRALAMVQNLWEGVGARVDTMSVAHHDQILAITSHIPHLIAFTIVDTAVVLGEDLCQEVVQYAASGFRDFTRIAASDPTMWRDIFLTNKQAVLSMLDRFTEDLDLLKTAIREDQGEVLFKTFTNARRIRRDIITAGQA
ncbi:MAG: prephenate dehydrogenase/arogenate dehydrogenase family protein [Alphaproteobacteria bacterium]